MREQEDTTTLSTNVGNITINFYFGRLLGFQVEYDTPEVVYLLIQLKVTLGSVNHHLWASEEHQIHIKFPSNIQIEHSHFEWHLVACPFFNDAVLSKKTGTVPQMGM